MRHSSVIVRVLSCSAFAPFVLACAGEGARAPGVTPPTTSPRVETRSTLPAPSSGTMPPRGARPDPAAIYARIEPGLASCYAQGRSSTPTMLDGKLTLNASIEANGKATCVIPTEDVGLTQEVEDCMSARLGAQTFDEGAPWTVSVPVLVRGGKVNLGQRVADTMSIQSVETHRMPDAFDVLEKLEPGLLECVRGLDRGAGVRSLIVAARVGLDGRAQCALASTPGGDLPPGVGNCAAGVLRAAAFPPPKGGLGLVLVPLNLGR